MEASNETIALKMEGVSKSYETGTPVLDACDLSVAAGESVSVVGPSGSGKSTLLNIAAALDVPDAGRVFVDGADIAGMDDRQLAEMRNLKIGFIFQEHHLLEHCTVAENVLLPSVPAGDRGAGAGADAARLLRRVGLAGRADDIPSRLSGGQRQRVAVVRALVNRPRLVLADEPTGSLDGDAADAVADLLAGLVAEEGVAMVLVTHDETIAGRCSRQLVLRSGRLSPAGGNDR